MGIVETVRGPVAPAALGTTLMHEHVFVLSPEILANYGTAYWDEEERVNDAVAKLRELRALGVETIVDPTVLGLGRDVARIARVNAQVDLNIVVATGLYTYDELPQYFYRRGRAGDVAMVEFFKRDIETGIGATGVKAGLLKCAIDARGLRPGVERAMRAVARVAVETGVPITVHTCSSNRSGLEAQRVFTEEGVDLTKVVIGHAGDSSDLEYLTALADAGSYLGMDRFGIDAAQPLEARIATVAALCARGYAPKMVLSHDCACYIDWLDETTRAAEMPQWDYTLVQRAVLPALRAGGVSDDQIATMLVANPRAYFTR